MAAPPMPKVNSSAASPGSRAARAPAGTARDMPRPRLPSWEIGCRCYGFPVSWKGAAAKVCHLRQSVVLSVRQLVENYRNRNTGTNSPNTAWHPSNSPAARPDCLTIIGCADAPIRPEVLDRLYQMLEEEAERRGKTPPPPPMTHALDHEPTEEDKMERLAEQVVWPDRNQLLHRVQEFLERMPTSWLDPR